MVNDTFWINDIYVLFENDNILPTKEMSLEKRMNTLTKLVFILSIILYLLNFSFVDLYLIFSVTIIIILYYLQIKPMDNKIIENFQNNRQYKKKSDMNCIQKKDTVFQPSQNLDIIDTKISKRNKTLSGPPNPKTLRNPIVVAPPTDLSYWKKNQSITHSSTNTSRTNDFYNSGYISIPDKYINNNTLNDFKKHSNIDYPDACSNHHKNTCETFEYKRPKRNYKNSYLSKNTGIHRECGYDKNNIQHNIPINKFNNNKHQNEIFDGYNENLYTHTVMPGMYLKSTESDPINSNLGISFTKRNRNFIKKQNGENDVFIETNQSIIEPVSICPNNVDPADVYDPRHTGYGTSYRSYVDKKLGQPKFYYDDINAVRMPNYITRSNIDIINNMNTYGQQNNNTPENLRGIVHKNYLDGVMKQRHDIQTNFMKKYKDRFMQLREMPLR
jgi:hypothetical protein